MKKPILITLFLGLVFCLIVFFGNSAKTDILATNKNKTLKIGAVLPLTGNNGFIGEFIQKGANVAIKELKDSGYSIELSVEDDMTDAKQTVSASQKLLTQNVDGIFIATVQQVKPIAHLFKNSQIPLLVTWDANEYTSALGDPVFSFGFSTEGAGYSIANYTNSIGVKKMAIVGQKDEWSELVAISAKKQFIKNGGSVPVHESLSIDVRDYKTVISRILQSKVDAVYLPLLPNYIAPFLKQVRDMGYKGILLSGDAVSPGELANVGNYAEGLIYANAWSDPNSNFTIKYKSLYGKEPEDLVFTGFGYDAVMTYYEAHKKSISNNISLLSGMKQVSFSAISKNIDFTHGNTSQRLEKLYRIEKSVPVLID